MRTHAEHTLCSRSITNSSSLQGFQKQAAASVNIKSIVDIKTMQRGSVFALPPDHRVLSAGCHAGEMGVGVNQITYRCHYSLSRSIRQILLHQSLWGFIASTGSTRLVLQRVKGLLFYHSYCYQRYCCQYSY